MLLAKMHGGALTKIQKSFVKRQYSFLSTITLLIPQTEVLKCLFSLADRAEDLTLHEDLKGEEQKEGAYYYSTEATITPNRDMFCY